jgi:uncharacterized protein YpuA (DUF1002 family)
MKMRSKLAIALLIAALLSIGAWNGYGQTSKPTTVKYEYAVIEDPTETHTHDEGVNTLNKFGAEGWEVIGVTSKAENRYTRIFLKRTIK